MQPTEEWIARIEGMQRELIKIHDYHQGYLDRRARSGITTATDTVMTRHQHTLVEAAELFESLKATIVPHEE